MDAMTLHTERRIAFERGTTALATSQLYKSCESTRGAKPYAKVRATLSVKPRRNMSHNTNNGCMGTSKAFDRMERTGIVLWTWTLPLGEFPSFSNETDFPGALDIAGSSYSIVILIWCAVYRLFFLHHPSR